MSPNQSNLKPKPLTTKLTKPYESVPYKPDEPPKTRDHRPMFGQYFSTKVKPREIADLDDPQYEESKEKAFDHRPLIDVAIKDIEFAASMEREDDINLLASVTQLTRSRQSNLKSSQSVHVFKHQSVIVTKEDDDMYENLLDDVDVENQEMLTDFI